MEKKYINQDRQLLRALHIYGAKRNIITIYIYNNTARAAELASLTYNSDNAKSLSERASLVWAASQGIYFHTCHRMGTGSAYIYPRDSSHCVCPRRSRTSVSHRHRKLARNTVLCDVGAVSEVWGRD
jgi:hypothetical protein